MTLADPEALARLHRAACAHARPWSAPEFARLLARADTVFCHLPQGYALGRAILDEAELLSLAVSGQARGRGLGRALLAGFEAAARARGARRAFLEVAADNAPEITLYTRSGWRQVGHRRNYYPQARPGRPRVDALLFGADLAPDRRRDNGKPGEARKPRF